ncbi:hypothetical protein [Chamaesiphon sp. VAR_48_metabat_403]|uniref:hypothetical protein n=1 Tax=Chamaesiphon sp. VAR_48_metabat_403 TaxID=2964700 RepID=UPI00286DF6D1|nr:hypothetical protein [Chamaesiphon sp. VAR_48_metabat_403]
MLHILLVGAGCFCTLMFAITRWFGLWMPDTTEEKPSVLELSWTFLVYAIICFGLAIWQK